MQDVCSHWGLVSLTVRSTRSAIDTRRAAKRDSALRMLPAGSARCVNSGKSGPVVRPHLWWWCWAGTFVVAVVLFLVAAPARQPAASDAKDAMRQLLPLLPLVLSVIVRWLALPFALNRRAGFVVFVVGLALAAASVVLAALGLGRSFLPAGMLAVLQFVPLFLLRSRPLS